jgi:hypothetical protein
LIGLTVAPRPSDRRSSRRAAPVASPAGSNAANPSNAAAAAGTVGRSRGDGRASAKGAVRKRTTVHLHPEDQHRDHVDAYVKGGTDGSSTHLQPSDTRPADDATTAANTSELPPWPVIDPFEEAVRREQVRGRIDKSQLALSEPRRERDPDHLKRVASRPCLVCGRNRAQAHHLTHLQPRAIGRKVSDEFTVPLCSTHHRKLHGSGN